MKFFGVLVVLALAAICSSFAREVQESTAKKSLARRKAAGPKQKHAFSRKAATNKGYRTRHDPDSTRHKRAVLPASFDVRTKWPACSATFNYVRDQGNCESGWAHAAVSVISDRVCIVSGGSVNRVISVQNVLNCIPSSYLENSLINDNYWYIPDSESCQEMDQGIAFRTFVNQGLVTGTADSGCMPFEGICGTATNDACPTSCPNTLYGKTFTADKTYGMNTVGIGYSYGSGANYTWTQNPNDGWDYSNGGTPKDVESLMKEEIYNNGPISALFDYYEDIYDYVGGVYQSDGSAEYYGTHVVKIIGWGIDSVSGLPYWLCVNSWGPEWGESGMIRILRGSNNVNIENWIYTVTPTVSGAATTAAPPTTTKAPMTTPAPTAAPTTTEATTAAATTTPSSSTNFCTPPASPFSWTNSQTWPLLNNTNPPAGQSDATTLTSYPSVQDYIVRKHNCLRTLPGATGMYKLSWDSEAAARAAAWVETCPQLVHDSSANRKTSKYECGQNAACGSWQMTWSEAINMWYNEVKDFVYNGTSTGTVGHYTQVVWDTTFVVGCAYKYCPNNPGVYQHLYYCNYCTPGNWGGVLPFKKGAPCSACPAGSTCPNGKLCVHP